MVSVNSGLSRRARLNKAPLSIADLKKREDYFKRRIETRRRIAELCKRSVAR